MKINKNRFTLNLSKRFTLSLPKSFILGLSKGFTLIELLIVITIIGILTALITTNLQGARSRARDTRRKSDLRAIEQSVRLYYNDAKRFPASDSFSIQGCTSIASPSVCSWGDTFATDSSTYMGSLPLDPSSSTATQVTYKYVSSDDDEFLLVAQLENLSDPDIADSQSRCSGLYGNYAGDTTRDFVICAQ